MRLLGRIIGVAAHVGINEPIRWNRFAFEDELGVDHVLEILAMFTVRDGHFHSGKLVESNINVQGRLCRQGSSGLPTDIDVRGGLAGRFVEQYSKGNGFVSMGKIVLRM